MAFCTQCGVEVQDDAKFCESCGAPVGDAADTPVVNHSVGNANHNSDDLDECDISEIALDGGQRNTLENSVATKPDIPIPQVIYALSKRVAVCAICRIIFAGLQTLFIVIAYLVIGTNGKSKIFKYYLFVGALSVFGFLLGLKDLKFSKTMLGNYPIGLKKLLYGKSKSTVSTSDLLILINGGLCVLSFVVGKFLFDDIDMTDMAAVMVIIFGVICGLNAIVAIFDTLFIRKFAKKNWEEIDEYISQFNIEEECDDDDED